MAEMEVTIHLIQQEDEELLSVRMTPFSGITASSTGVAPPFIRVYWFIADFTCEGTLPDFAPT